MTHFNKLGIADGDFHLFRKVCQRKQAPYSKHQFPRFALHKGVDLTTVKDLNIISETICRKWLFQIAEGSWIQEWCSCPSWANHSLFLAFEFTLGPEREWVNSVLVVETAKCKISHKICSENEVNKEKHRQSTDPCDMQVSHCSFSSEAASWLSCHWAVGFLWL